MNRGGSIGETLGSGEELVVFMESRGHFYRLLSRVFAREVDAEFLAAVGSEKALMAAMRELSRRGQDVLRDFFRRASEMPAEALVLELAVEYATLFLGTGRSSGRSALPYASVYLSQDRCLMQEPFVRIRSFYAEAGFSQVSGSRELDDHISVVLEFLSHMAVSTADRLTRGDSAAASERLLLQDTFLKEHVLTWVPAFCRDVSRYDTTGLYKGFALIASAFVKADKDVVRDARRELEN